MPSSTRAGRLAALALLALTPSVVHSQDVRAGDLVVQHPWARATPNGAQVAGGYLTVVNHGSTADTMTGGSLIAAEKAEIHDMATENGVMLMRPTGPLDISAGGSVTLSPSGCHLMFTGLKRGLTKGEEIDGTFARAGTVPVRFEVEPIGSRAPSGTADHAMPAMDMN